MEGRFQLTYEGPLQFVATDRRPQPIRLILECLDGLPAGTDVRV